MHRLQTDDVPLHGNAYAKLFKFMVYDLLCGKIFSILPSKRSLSSERIVWDMLLCQRKELSLYHCFI